MDSSNKKHYFLQGGGEMRALIRSKDWSKTPIGNPGSWPQSLATMVGVMLDNPFGMYIAWGREYTQIYNDGYRPMLGSTKHPEALGNSARQTFAEIWHIIEPMFEGVMNGVPVHNTDFMLQLDRHGYLETCYFDFAYSPIRFENGEVGGVLVTVVETTTNRNRVEEELRVSNHQLEFVIEAAQLGTFDYDPVTETFSGNARMESWFGLPPQGQLGFSEFLDLLATNDRERVAKAVATALDYSSGGVYEVEYTIIHPFTKNETMVHAKGKAWFGENKMAYRLNGTLEDITEKTLATRRQRETEQHIRTMVLESPVGICVLDAATLVAEIVNDSFVEIAGKPYGEIMGRFHWDAFSEVRSQYEEALNKVVETGQPFYAHEVELMLLRHGRPDTVYITFVYAPLKDEAGLVVKVAVWVLDNTMQVTARKKIMVSENNLRLMILQAPIAIAILRGNDHRVEIANKYSLELWGRTEEEVLGISVFESMPELAGQGIRELLDDVATTGRRFASPERPIRLMRHGELQTFYINFSYEALYDGEGNVNGIMAIGFDVTQQVTARMKVEESEQNVRALVESAPFPIGVYIGENMRIILANQSIMDIWGKGNDVIGKTFDEILPELESQEIFGQVQRVLKTGVPFHARNQRVDLVKDGVLKSYYFNYSFTPLFDATGTPYAVMNTAAEVTELHEAKQKVEESEKRFRESVQQAPLGIAIFRGRDFTAEMANENYLLLVDKKEHEFVGRPLFDVLPEVRSVVEPLFEEVVRSGNPFYSPELLATLKRRGRKEQAYFNLVYHPLKEENGEISGIMVVAMEVTQTVVAKHLLEENERHFRLMVMQSPIPMTILKGRDFIIESANRAMFETLWRKKESDVLGKSILEVFPELREQKYPELLLRVFTTGKPHTEKESVAFVQGDDGMKRFFLDFEYAALLGPDGSPAGIMITVNDVTDKVEARRKVEEAEERMRLAAEATDLATWELDLQTREMIHSSRLNEIYGYAATKLLTHEDVRKKIVEEDRLGIVEPAFDKALKGGAYFFEARLRKTKGDLRWIRVQGKAIYDESGKPLKMVGTLRDITDEKQHQQALLEREQKFRLLADSMPQHVWTADPDGKLNYFNQSVYDYSGFTPDELQKEGWLQIVHPDDREENIRQWTHAVQTGTDYLFEHRFRKSNGEYRWQLSRAMPQRDADGTIKMWVGTSTDIQEQKMFLTELENQVRQRTKELNLRNEELEKTNKELESFVYISSHDLQEPLRKIQTFSSRIAETEYSNLSEKGMHLFSRMQESAYRMQNLIQDLLAYSRTTINERKLSEVGLEKVIDEIREIMREELEQKNVGLVLHGNHPVKIIPFQFNQLLLNLIGNSIKFASIDRPLRIDIDCETGFGWEFGLERLVQEKHYCHIRVADNGIGFEQQYSDRIFQVFQRLHRKEDYEGTGIGLAIVKKIVDNHNGIISASGELGKGATFHIYIPD